MLQMPEGDLSGKAASFHPQTASPIQIDQEGLVLDCLLDPRYGHPGKQLFYSAEAGLHWLEGCDQFGVPSL